MLSNLYLHNFKAFSDLDIEIKPITLLLGPNNSGKSSIIALLRLLIQTIESNDSDVPLLLNGIMGDFGTFRDIVHGNHRGRPIEVDLVIHPPIAHPKNDLFQNYWNEIKDEIIEVHLTFKYRTKLRELILKSSEFKLNGVVKLTTGYSEDTERQIINRIGDIDIPSSLKASLSRGLRMQNFLPMQAVPIRILGRRDSSTSEFVTEQMDQDMRDIMRYTRLIERFLRDIEYIGAMRVSPSRTHLFTGERRTRIGADGQNAPNILAMDSARRGSRRRGIAKMVSEWLKKAGIASDFVVHPISDRHYEIRVQHPVTKEYQNLADVGYGNSQIMPVLIGGYNLVRGATYLVEEPEIHLHPRAQAELGDFLLDLYHGGIQSIVETHSEHLILRLQQHVARKVIPKDHIRFYYIYASNKKKIAKPLRLDELGRFIDDWPQGFFPERLEEAKKLAQVRFESERSGE